MLNNAAEALLDSLDTHIVVIDHEGSIQYVNQSWKDFAVSNGMDVATEWLGSNYLAVCCAAANDEDEGSINIVEGMQSVIDKIMPAFEYEYPCHSPNEERWYHLRMAPLKSIDNRFVISHQNITRIKLVEIQAEKLSVEDPLTSLYNRRGLDIFIKEEMARAVRYKTEVSFVVIDVDYFKQFNDCYGHQAGDRCLMSIAKMIQYHARRPGDIAARIGGDEFVLVLSQTSQEQALNIVNAIKQKVFDLAMVVSNKERVTISAGIVSLVPTANTDYKETMFKLADSALYAAKKQRNCVLIFDV